MKYYISYMEKQQVSPEFHEKLGSLADTPRRKTGSRPWLQFGALAACCALVLGIGAWGLGLGPQGGGTEPGISAEHSGQPEQTPDSSTSAGGAAQDSTGPNSFVVEGAGGEKMMFPMIPYVNYQDVTGAPELAASISLSEGSFSKDLTQEDIETIFWGPEGKPEAVHPKAEQGDLPWMLFWEGYAVRGYVIYDGSGRLFWLHIFGEHPDGPTFHLELALDRLPPTCLVNPDLETTDVLGVPVTGWKAAYDRNGDKVTDYVCGSEFMAGDIGVRFENTGATFRVDPGDGWDPMEAACQFNALFVRQALASDGGLYLDHLKETEDVPAWREAEFSSLAQARQEAEFAPYLPQSDIPGYGKFYGRLTYQEGYENTLFVRWSRGYDNVEVYVCRPEGEPWWGETVDVSNPASYDTRLYTIPWCDSVPKEYREDFYSPTFRAEDMSLSVVEARGTEKDTGGLTYCFGVLHPDGTLVRYTCDGLKAEQVWALVEPTLPESGNSAP